MKHVYVKMKKDLLRLMLIKIMKIYKNEIKFVYFKLLNFIK